MVLKKGITFLWKIITINQLFNHMGIMVKSQREFAQIVEEKNLLAHLGGAIWEMVQFVTSLGVRNVDKTNAVVYISKQKNQTLLN